jgi:GntR family transcriptional regulator of arabinose operon
VLNLLITERLLGSGVEERLLEIKPKYKQIKDFLAHRISTGQYAEGEKIPSENELAQQFSVSRHTVIKALNELINEEMICRRQGMGSFVAPARTRRKNRIGVIIYHSDNPYYSRIIRGIENYAERNGFYIVLCNSEGDILKEESYIRGLLSEVDGFLISPSYMQGELSPGVRLLLQKEIPFVLVSRLPSHKVADNIDFVIPDDYRGGYMITRHLLDTGYMRVFFLTVVGLQKQPEIQDRFLGYKKALSDAGIPFDERFVLEAADTDPLHGYEKDGYRMADRIISMTDRPFAVFAIGDSMAIGLMRGLREKGIKVPRDIALCGFDDIDLAGQWGIDLTTIRHPAAEMGEKAMEVLLQAIEKGKSGGRQIVLPVELKVRKTSLMSETRMPVA